MPERNEASADEAGAELTDHGGSWYHERAEAHAEAQGTGSAGKFVAMIRMRCVAFRRSE